MDRLAEYFSPRRRWNPTCTVLNLGKVSWSNGNGARCGGPVRRDAGTHGISCPMPNNQARNWCSSRHKLRGERQHESVWSQVGIRTMMSPNRFWMVGRCPDSFELG